MTSDDRNRRMKYGHDVPRWWIPEFNNTHNDKTDQDVPALDKESAVGSADKLLMIAKSQDSRQKVIEQQRKWAEHNISQATAASRSQIKRQENSSSSLKRRSRQKGQNQQRHLLYRDIRIVQWFLAGLFALTGGIVGGVVGLVICVFLGLVILSVRLEF